MKKRRLLLDKERLTGDSQSFHGAQWTAIFLGPSPLCILTISLDLCDGPPPPPPPPALTQQAGCSIEICP